MISDIDVLGALFSDGVRGDKDLSLIIPTDWDRLHVVVKLLQKGMHPNSLAATIREHHVFNLSGKQGNSLLGP